MRKRSLILSYLACGFLAFGQATARATFIIDPDPGGEKFFIDVANHDVSTFNGSIGSNTSAIDATVTTTQNVDTGAGFATIKPTVPPGGPPTILSSLTFTPTDPNAWSDFNFRGQLNSPGTVHVEVQDNQGNAPQGFDFVIANANQDFSRIGIISTDGETIQSVTLTNPSFKEVKQIQFSPIPEPTSLALIGIGLGSLAAVRVLRRRTKPTVA